MFDATVNSSVSHVKQLNIVPYLALFPTALEQSKFFQQYRIAKVKVTCIPLTATNTQTTSAVAPTGLLYSVPLYDSSTPGVS